MANSQKLLTCMDAVFFFLVFALSIEKHTATGGLVTGDAAAVRTCKRQCGAVEVPFPFGLDEDDPSCFYLGDGVFSLTCNTSFHPPMLSWNGVYVSDINIYGGKMRILMNISVVCYSPYGGFTWSVFTHDPSFSFSYTDNIYVGIGCDTMAYIRGYASGDYIGGVTSANFTGGCMSSCESLDQVREGDCSGIGCCQTSIPKGLRGYGINLGSNNNHSVVLDFNPCSYAFVVEKNNYTFKVSDLNMSSTQALPIVLDWCLGTQGCQVAMGNHTYACIDEHSQCVNATNGPGYLCQCSPGFRGNPYIQNGCKDIDECQDPNICHRGAVCVNTPGNYSCICPLGTTDDPYGYGCEKIPAKQTKPSAVLVEIVTIATFIFLIAMGIWIYSIVHRKEYNKQKKRYFHQNGGFILQAQISHNGIQNSFKIFTKEEIDKATNNFDQNQVIGRGGNGVVFKGKLPNDDRTFAIKKSILLDGSRVEEFINEILILSQINHKNVVRILGCCLEVEEPLLVYEYIPNGTLSYNIHQGCLPWEIRMKIASEVADALAHLHFKVNIPIVHRDVKSSNILLDDDYIAKVSDFGASKMIPYNELQITTLVQGTLGYLDPEYIQSSQLTDKSDVYSFGVVLLELITGKLPFSCQRSEAEKSLAAMFISYMKKNKLGELLDERIMSSSNMDQLEDIANLSLQCLSLSGADRPSMNEVSRHLDKMRKNEHLPDIHYSVERQSIHDEMVTITNSSNAYVEYDQTTTLLELDLT